MHGRSNHHAVRQQHTHHRSRWTAQTCCLAALASEVAPHALIRLLVARDQAITAWGVGWPSR
jgi:hypothetical protein